MTTTDTRAVFLAAIDRMTQAHDALLANVCPATLAAYEAAIDEAREAHRHVEARAVERAERSRR